MDTSNAGRFQKVLAIAATYPDSAAYLNSIITPSGESETLLQAFNVLYFDKIQSGDTLSPADSSGLEYLTLLSRSAYGNIVHDAVATLFLEIHPEEISLRSVATQSNSLVPSLSINSNYEVKIFPNPGKENIAFVSTSEINMIEFYNAYGSLLLKERLKARETVVDINTLPAGVYIVKTMLLSGNVVIKKFILQK
jgi:Secretion system C-terminal sorting domain